MITKNYGCLVIKASLEFGAQELQRLVKLIGVEAACSYEGYDRVIRVISKGYCEYGYAC